MGETSAETKREIESLRAELSEIVDELERRGRASLNLQAQVTRHPAATGVLAVGASAALGGLLYTLVNRARERRREQISRRRQPTVWLADLSRRWRPSPRKDRGGEGGMRQVARREPSVLKRLLWAATSALIVTLATLLARRLSVMLWERAMREKPPAKAAA